MQIRPQDATRNMLRRLQATTINIRSESYRVKDRRKAGLVPPRVPICLASCKTQPAGEKVRLVILIPVLLRQARPFSTVFNPSSARRCDSTPEALAAVTVVMLPRGW